MARAPDRERSSLGRVRAPPDLRIPAVAAEGSNSGRVGIFSTAAISPSKQLLGYPACCLCQAPIRPSKFRFRALSRLASRKKVSRSSRSRRPPAIRAATAWRRISDACY
jgi:hypothetical protein